LRLCPLVLANPGAAGRWPRPVTIRARRPLHLRPVVCRHPVTVPIVCHGIRHMRNLQGWSTKCNRGTRRFSRHLFRNREDSRTGRWSGVILLSLDGKRGRSAITVQPYTRRKRAVKRESVELTGSAEVRRPPRAVG